MDEPEGTAPRSMMMCDVEYRRLSQISAILLGLVGPICAAANGEIAAKLLNGPEVIEQCHYPPKALQAHAEGETLLSLVVDDTGKL